MSAENKASDEEEGNTLLGLWNSKKQAEAASATVENTQKIEVSETVAEKAAERLETSSKESVGDIISAHKKEVK